jgi:hypothetical protein
MRGKVELRVQQLTVHRRPSIRSCRRPSRHRQRLADGDRPRRGGAIVSMRPSDPRDSSRSPRPKVDTAELITPS